MRRASNSQSAGPGIAGAGRGGRRDVRERVWRPFGGASAAAVSHHFVENILTRRVGCRRALPLLQNATDLRGRYRNVFVPHVVSLMRVAGQVVQGVVNGNANV